MSLECGECERDLRGRHDESCSRYRSPYRVRCPEHGFVYLTPQNYSAQLSRADDCWRCPICLSYAHWDDEWYDDHIEAWCTESETEA
jgi:hypothetical protein